MAVVSLMATPAIADVTVTSQVAGKAGESQSITYIKGLKMRSDSSMLGTPTTTITDIEAQKFISINHKKKEVTIYDMAQFRQELDKSMKAGEAKSSLKPNGQKKDIAGTRLHRLRHLDNDADGDGPGRHGDDDGDERSGVHRQGRSRIGRLCQVPQRRRGKGLHHVRPARGQGQPFADQGHDEPVQGDGRDWRHSLLHGNERQDRRRRAHGRDDEQGDGRGAAFTQTVTAVSTDAVPDDKFALPADYKVKDSK